MRHFRYFFLVVAILLALCIPLNLEYHRPRHAFFDALLAGMNLFCFITYPKNPKR